MAYNSGQLRGKIRLYVNNGFFGVPYSQTNPYVIHDEYVGWWESNHKWDKIGTLISSTNWIDVFITLDLHPAPQKENKKHTQKKKNELPGMVDFQHSGSGFQCRQANSAPGPQRFFTQQAMLLGIWSCKVTAGILGGSSHLVSGL